MQTLVEVKTLIDVKAHIGCFILTGKMSVRDEILGV